MNLNEAIKWLESKRKFKAKTNIDNMYKAMSMLGNPEKKFKTIHVTGTNGKGSVSHFLSETIAQFSSVGLFTSPYIIKFNERIQINNKMISDLDLLKYILWGQEFEKKYLAKTGETFSFFELLTIIVYQYFADQKVMYAIIEVGIGGLLDATNVVNSELAIITSIGYDHQAQLGNSLKEILSQKLGILKENKTLVTGVSGFSGFIKRYVKNKKGNVVFLKPKDTQIINPFPLTFTYQKELYHSLMQGLYQAKNASLAILALKKMFPNLEEKIIKKGIQKAVNPGRFEVVRKEPFVILDGAHNLLGIKSLIKSLKVIFKDKKLTIIFTAMKDKPYLKMIKLLKRAFADVVLTSLDYHRAIDEYNQSLEKSFKIIKDPQKAYDYAYEKLDKDDVLVITGSLYFVSFMRKYII